MSDIQKLKKVIDSLEEQSSKVSEFNGVLIAVSSAKADILSVKKAFEELADEQNKLVEESHTRFDEYGDQLAVLELKLSAIESKILTASQFEVGRDKLLLRISELRFVTPEQFEQGVSNAEKTVTSLVTECNSKLEGIITAQDKSIRSLRIYLLFGMLLLAGGILFLARDAFL